MGSNRAEPSAWTTGDKRSAPGEYERKEYTKKRFGREIHERDVEKKNTQASLIRDRRRQ